MSHEFERVNTMIEEVHQDMEDRMANLEAIKGRNFAMAVMLLVKQVQLLDFAINAPTEVATALAPVMGADIMRDMCKALGMDKETMTEAFDIAKGMSHSLHDNVVRIREAIGD